MKKMDASTADRINQLAKNLREMKIATSMEDALLKAREIVTGIEGGKPLNQANEADLITPVEKAAVEEAKDEPQVEQFKEQVSEVKQEQTRDELNNSELQEQQSEVSLKLKHERAQLEKIKKEVEAAKEALEAAKQKHDEFAPSIMPAQDIPPSPDVHEAPPAPEPEKERPALSEKEKKMSNLSDVFNYGKR